MFWNNKKTRLHLGCGNHILNGWINIDLDSPTADLHADLTQPLKFKDESIEYIYSEHFIEHITRDQALSLLRECRRVLTTGGTIRLSTPNLKWLVEKYIASDLREWEDVNWLPNSSCNLMNEGMRSWGHQYLYDQSELIAILHEAGFSSPTLCKHQDSSHDGLKNLECRPFHQELIIEAYKL
jgi:predicted SAM-dependent methyltransferase